MEWQDIGHGVRIAKHYVDGLFVGVAYVHGDECEGYAVVKREGSLVWSVLQEEPLTLSPSLLCLACGHHGFIREGRWVPA